MGELPLQASAAVKPQGIALPTFPLQPLPYLPPDFIAKRKERGRTANSPNCPLPHPTSYCYYPLHAKGRAQMPNPSRLGGSHSSPIQEEKVPSGQLGRPLESQRLAGVGTEMGSAARNGQNPQVQAMPVSSSGSSKDLARSSPFCPQWSQRCLKMSSKGVLEPLVGRGPRGSE